MLLFSDSTSPIDVSYVDKLIYFDWSEAILSRFFFIAFRCVSFFIPNLFFTEPISMILDTNYLAFPTSGLLG